MKNEIPVYLFTGFLESGKSTFIQGTLEDSRFNSGEKTLLLLCEEGEVDYDKDYFANKNVFINIINEEDDLSSKILGELEKKYLPERIIIEYNGMWTLDKLYSELPDNWVVYQEFMFADASTFEMYNQNMRSLVVDKLQTCEVVSFINMKEVYDKLSFHKIVRALNRKAIILYDYGNDNVIEDDIEDPLPFDINAPIIKINDTDFAIWYRDLMEDTEKYKDKTISFKALLYIDKTFPEKTFAAGRHIMTCCADDIAYSALACIWANAVSVKSGSWADLTGKISIGYNKIYGKEGPYIKISKVEKCLPPEEMVVSF